MKKPEHSLLLIDGHALLYRAFHALPPLRTKEGLPTNALYGFITTILKAIEELQPKYWAVAFDLSGPTFRHQQFEGYKASRPDTPTDLAQQIPYAYKIAEALNIPIFTAEGFEADDVIGTLAHQAKKLDVPVIIATGDKDSFQLVDDTTFVYLIRRSISEVSLYDQDLVKERMGVNPNQIVDYKALAGDASDEIPGIAGIGEKTAVTLLAHASSIDELYSLLHQDAPSLAINERLKEKLKTGEAIARQSLNLARINCNVPLTLDLTHCLIRDYDANQAAVLLQQLEFYSLLKRLPALEKADQAPTLQARDWSYTTLVTEPELKQAIHLLAQQSVLCVDTETDGLNGPIIGISLAADKAHGYYIPLIQEHGCILPKATIAELLRHLLENEKIAKVGHNLKYDIAILKQLAINLKPITFDTMIAAYILHAHLRSFDFDSVAQRELGYIPISFSEVAGSTKKAATLKNASGDKVAEYAAEDAIITFRLHTYYQQAFKDQPKLKKVAETIDFPLIAVLIAMEERGVCINTKTLQALGQELDREIEANRHKIESYASEPLNINSPTQLQKLLFDHLKLDRGGIKTTQSGLSTAAQELEKLQGLHPVIDYILRYRELTKLQSTYVKTLPELADTTGRIHTQFSQTTAATGRLSSSDPNLQNIPIRTELGNKIRTAFVAPPGYAFVSFDYSQFELRIIAHLADDKKLQQVFLDNRDIHSEVAKAMGVDRRAAKAINFGIIYGLSAFGLSQGLKIDQKTAKQYIDTYFSTYPALADYLKRTKEEIRTKGYVETLLGRRREIPEIQAANAVVRAQAERMAINAPAQGTEADLIKLAMIQIHDWLETKFQTQTERPYLVLQVHDSLLLEVPQALIGEVTHHVKACMESVYKLAVPLIVDCSMGQNWGELQKLTLN